MAAEKARLRERFQAARLALPPEARAAASRAICRAVQDVHEVATLRGGVAALFWPRVERAEVDLRPLAGVLRAQGVTVALPRVVGDGQMTWHAWDGEPLVPGRWGLLEPSASAQCIAPVALDLVAVPGVAFGADGARLGWGGGFYDRTLAQTGALKIGVTFATALAATLPTAPHDARVDVVVTENGVVRPDPPFPPGTAPTA